MAIPAEAVAMNQELKIAESRTPGDGGRVQGGSQLGAAAAKRHQSFTQIHHQPTHSPAKVFSLHTATPFSLGECFYDEVHREFAA